MKASARAQSWPMAVGLAAVAAWWTGCREVEAEPVETAKAFAQAIQRADESEIIALLERRARVRLAHAAERAGNQVGGRRNIDSSEMLQVVDVDPTFQIARAELISGDHEDAQVRLIGADRTAHVVALVREEGTWRVRIPMPLEPVPPPTAEPVPDPRGRRPGG